MSGNISKLMYLHSTCSDRQGLDDGHEFAQSDVEFRKRARIQEHVETNLIVAAGAAKFAAAGAVGVASPRPAGTVLEYDNMIHQLG
jgi:hypothetical protein